MTEYSKFNIIYRLQKWLDSVPGQTFLNYAYSWGASIVILGTLFKLTHLPGANIMLYIGMGTEVIVFFISAFDRPFDKTADGKDLPTHAFGEEEAEEGAAGAVGQSAQAAGAGPVVYGGGGTVSSESLRSWSPNMFCSNLASSASMRLCSLVSAESVVQYWASVRPSMLLVL